jgi:hypothetical protein
VLHTIVIYIVIIIACSEFYFGLLHVYKYKYVKFVCLPCMNDHIVDLGQRGPDYEPLIFDILCFTDLLSCYNEMCSGIINTGLLYRSFANNIPRNGKTITESSAKYFLKTNHYRIS